MNSRSYERSDAFNDVSVPHFSASSSESESDIDINSEYSSSCDVEVWDISDSDDSGEESNISISSLDQVGSTFPFS